MLYLCHRIPYPPNKGDKIRSFHWLKGLAESFDIYLGTFVDDENDWQYVDHLKQFCAEVYVQKLEPKKAKLKSLLGLVTGEPLTIPYYKNKSMQTWLDGVLEREKVDNILVFSSSMVQYIDRPKDSDYLRVVDFVDMDSDKWMQYAENKSWPVSWIYQREASKLLEYEQTTARSFNKSLFVSSKEAELFSTKLQDQSVQVDYVNNGVDTNYFSVSDEFASPYQENEKVIVFTGAMDYWANVDAVKWFASEIFPDVKRENCALRFVIVGSKPTHEVLNLQAIDGVSVTGFVDDVRPYIMHADLVVAPMRIARGIQNKVLEAMSMGKNVLVSPQGFEGIDAQPGRDLTLLHSKQEWILKVIEVVNSPEGDMGKHARDCVVAKYSWKSNIAKLLLCFEGK